MILGKRRFVLAPFSSEAEIELAVFDNAELIFGPTAIYLPKAKFTTAEGVGTIPDGFAIDPEAGKWFIVEAELSSHRVWDHIAPQVTKQVLGSTQPETLRRIQEIAIEVVKTDPEARTIFADLGIDAVDIRRKLAEILTSRPIIGIPIDSVSPDLRDWATSLKNEVRLWIVRKYVEYGDQSNVIYEVPEEYRPALDTAESDEGARVVARYDVSIADLVSAGLLEPGSRLHWTHKPRSSGQKKTYDAEVGSSGGLEVGGQTFGSPSYAALFAMKSAGSSRVAVNGWTAWRDENGVTIAELRDKYLQDQTH